MSKRQGQRLSREQLIELVRKIMLAEADEAEMDDMVRTFEANVPHPDGSDLIFLADRRSQRSDSAGADGGGDCR